MTGYTPTSAQTFQSDYSNFTTVQKNPTNKKLIFVSVKITNNLYLIKNIIGISHDRQLLKSPYSTSN
ncbi:Uncharacterised protein [Zhongshania aliphaticivorans]|uniref:Uncharacterized protein n=1 Tax=Zhongshania aliphaticivorans TaxID=1470434 RepID=A0A5S9Q4G4_9GAMM|nr:Uncharacterised protein [Zhongshania aliphaticivorans]CAA0112021.1 Uncharacterised protein [Zhongshania aliphaticivorans]